METFNVEYVSFALGFICFGIAMINVWFFFYFTMRFPCKWYGKRNLQKNLEKQKEIVEQMEKDLERGE